MGCCSGSTSMNTPKTGQNTLKLDFLYLDESVCKPCRGTGQALDEAVEIVAAPLAALGVTLAIASRGDDGAPTDLAARVPASVELYVGFDTDLASDRWMHLEELLGTLGVLDRVIEEQLDHAVAANVQEAGGGGMVFDAALNAVSKRLGTGRDVCP